MNAKIVPPKIGHGKGIEINNSMFLDNSIPLSLHKGQNLPHWNQIGKLQFVTFRLADSLPSSKLEYLKELKHNITNRNFIIKIDDPDLFNSKIDFWLRQGIGSCILKFEKVQSLVNESINFYDGKRYDLYDYVIMPNHVHMLILPYDNLQSVISDLLRFTTKKINRLLNTKGKIWQSECFDRIVRSIDDFNRIVEYIIHNPANFPGI